jgi:predicted RNA-binding protein (virulence factor B family)
MSILLDEVEDLSEGSYREIRELKKDVEQIKQILNQFQGHLMYSDKSNSFGNRELR